MDYTLTYRARTVYVTPSCSLRRRNTLERLYPGVNFPHRLWLHSRLGTTLKYSGSQVPSRTRGNNKSTNNTTTTNNIHMVGPYTKGLSESIKNICSKVDIQVNFRGGNTIKNLLMAPRDRDITKKAA